MRKGIITIIVIILSIFMAMSALFGCVNHEEEVVIGDFVCQIWESNGTINLKDLSEEGKKKKYIVVPQELNGMKVNMLGYRNAVFSQGRSNWRSENLEKIFVQSKHISFFNDVFDACPKLNKCILIRNDYDGNSIFVDLQNQIMFMSAYRYYNNWGGDDKLPIDLTIHCVANISYYYNYEESPNNGYYWIDDVEDGELIEFIPEEPTREGYRFEGWYKEPECINEWDFENDRVIKAQIHLEGVEKFIENKLFAKWAEE